MAAPKHRASAIDEAEFAKASEQGRRLLARGPLATAAKYEAGHIRVELNNGCAFEFPVNQAQDLAGAKAADLRTIEISAAGLGLHWPKLDADLYVPSLVKGIFGTRRWMAEIGAAGGGRRPTRRAPRLAPMASSAGARASLVWKQRRPRPKPLGASDRERRPTGSTSTSALQKDAAP